jgi:hypothetical protein
VENVNTFFAVVSFINLYNEQDVIRFRQKVLDFNSDFHPLHVYEGLSSCFERCPKLLRVITFHIGYLRIVHMS